MISIGEGSSEQREETMKRHHKIMLAIGFVLAVIAMIGWLVVQS